MKKRPFLCIELLKTFSKKEIADLIHFVSCPCFNEDESMVGLLKSLRRYALNAKEFDAEVQYTVYEKTFANKSVSQYTLSNNQRSFLNAKMNVLMRLAEQFLAIQALKTNVSYKCELLYDTLLKRQQYWLLNRHLTKHKKELSQQKEKDTAYYAHQAKVEKVNFNYLHYSGQLIQEDNLPDLIFSTDLHYLLDKLELQITALSMQYLPGKKEYDLSSMKATTSLLNLPQYAGHPLIILYRANIVLMETESEEAYADLLLLVEQYESLVPITILKNFYTTAINYCVAQIHFGVLDYVKNMFNLYKLMDSKNLLIDNGFISANDLKNIVTAACRVEEFVWAEEAIERYRSYLRKPIRDSVCHFNLGVIAFHRQDYEAAHNKFIQVDKIDRIYDINIRILILKCLYEKEKEYSEPTMQAFRSAHKYFKDNQSLSAENKRPFINFIQILIKLYRLRHNINAAKADTERIKEKLEQQKVNSDKRWLLQKIEELGQKIK